MSPPRHWRPAFEQQTARINVDDRTWSEFRARCLTDGHHVSEALGRLVAAEVDRHREREAPEPERRPRTAAASRARERVDTTPAPTLFD